MTNEFYDVSSFPKDWGVITFGISMSNVAHSQSPQACIDALSELMPKIVANKVGAHFFYSDGLYMNFETDVFETKNNFAKTASAHMGAIRNILSRERSRFQIPDAFSFESWFQMYLSHRNFFSVYHDVRKFYNSDTEFQKWINEDAREQGRELNERQLSFYLEEHTFHYLLINRQLNLRNTFVQGREQWVFDIYPGKPPKGQVYLVQKDPLNLNKDMNPYKGQHDSLEKKFIDYLRVDLDTF